jgi:hypothetical protein
MATHQHQLEAYGANPALLLSHVNKIKHLAEARKRRLFMREDWNFMPYEGWD